MMKTIVVIEPENNLFRRINLNYTPQGYNVVACTTLLQALSVPATDVSFLAIDPRALDEGEATAYIESLKMRNPGTRILICATKDDYSGMSDALSAGADDYFVGPFEGKVLEERIDSMLA